MPERITPSEVRANVPDYRVISLVVACAIFMEQFDATVLATAMPSMARDFGVNSPSMSIALTAYLLMLAALIPVSGTLASHWGTKRVFGHSIWVFMAGSILCSLATSLPMLVAARVLQGIGGAMMAPLGRLLLLQCVDKRNLVSAMSWSLVPAFLGPMTGPALGGLIVTHLDWRWIFYVNIPIGLLGIWAVRRFIPAIPKDEHPAPFDNAGFVLSALALGCLLFGLETLGQGDHPGLSSVLLVVGLSALFGYIAHARKAPHPLLDLRVLRVDTFRLSMISGTLMRITQGAHPFLLPLMFQVGFGFSAEHSGRLVLATALGALLMRMATPWLLRRIGYRNGMLYNGILASAGYAVCALFRPDWPDALMFGLLVLCGAFMSFQFGAYNTVAYEDMPAERVNAASTLYTTLQQLMLSAGVCFGAMALHASMLAGYVHEPRIADFTVAFLAVTLVSITSLRWHLRFARDVGRELSGHGASAQAGRTA